MTLSCRVHQHYIWSSSTDQCCHQCTRLCKRMFPCVAMCAQQSGSTPNLAFPPISRHAPVLGEVHLAPVNETCGRSIQFWDDCSLNFTKPCSRTSTNTSTTTHFEYDLVRQCPCTTTCEQDLVTRPVVFPLRRQSKTHRSLP